ncbi:MAG: hypothetical protein KatS3mg068_0492 [Candidatus Sericytochromatia bacterium]|nr:MAG: hypothetical protein KatS3mg068_0492 [Candidatus Sericytochromatia bacterium]
MDDINLPKEIKIIINEIKNTTIPINSKTYLNQTQNFSKIISDEIKELINFSEVSNDSIINLDDEIIKRNSTSESNNKNKIYESKNQKSSTTNIYSSFIPQKITNIRNNEKKELNFKKDYKEEGKNYLEKMDTSKYPPEIAKRFQNIKEINKDKSQVYQDDKYTDRFIKENEENNPLSALISSKKDKEDNITIEQENKYPQDKEKDKDNKQSKNFIQQYREKKDKESLPEKVDELIKQYGLNKSWISLADSPKSAGFDEWIKSLIFGASKKNVSLKESEEISKYVTLSDKLHQTEKEIIEEILKQILQNKIIYVNSNSLVRMDKKAIELVIRLFPTQLLKGIIRKFSEEKINNGYKFIYKILNGIIVDDKEAEEILEYFNDFDDEEKNILKKIFKGFYTYYEIEKVYNIIAKLKKLDALFPGLPGFLQESFLDFYSNEQFQKSKQILSLLEKYSLGNDFNRTEAQSIAYLISKKHFNLKVINMIRLREILTNLIMKEKVPFICLEIIAKLSNKNPLVYLPTNIDPDMRDFLRFMPFSSNEVTLSSRDEIENKKSFVLIGKIKLYGLDYEFKLQVVIKNFFDDNHEIVVNLDEENIFMEKIPIGKYFIDRINFIYDQGDFPVEFSDPKHLSLLNFSCNNINEIFYFGTLKLFFEGEENKYLSDVKLKNDYKEMIQFNKNKSYFKNQKVKINPKLYKR